MIGKRVLNDRYVLYRFYIIREREGEATTVQTYCSEGDTKCTDDLQVDLLVLHTVQIGRIYVKFQKVAALNALRCRAVIKIAAHVDVQGKPS